jgi:hypothetical protein
VAEKDWDLRRTGEVRIDALLPLKRPKGLKSKVTPPKIFYRNTNKKLFLKFRKVSVPVFASPQQEAGARAIALSKTELGDLLANSVTSKSRRTVTIMLRDGTFVRLPYSSLVQRLADRYHRTMDITDRTLAQSKKFPAKKIIRPGVTLTRVGGVNVTHWPPISYPHLNPLRRGKR